MDNKLAFASPLPMIVTLMAKSKPLNAVVKSWAIRHIKESMRLTRKDGIEERSIDHKQIRQSKVPQRLMELLLPQQNPLGNQRRIHPKLAWHEELDTGFL